MTTEPRQEAERIVGEFVVAEVEQATEPSESGMYRDGAYRDRLVDALAAFIEARDAIKWDESRLHGKHGAVLLIEHEAACEFNRALSALREDET